MTFKTPGWLTKTFEVAGKIAKPIGEYTLRAGGIAIGAVAMGGGLLASYKIAQTTGITPNASWAIPVTLLTLGGGYAALGAAPRRVSNLINRLV
jgi:hypothetical protein